MIKFFTFLDKAFGVAIKGLLVAFLLTMVLLVAAQVILRDFFGSGISWSDVAARNMVLWIAFFGAILATRKRQHISIDIITRFIPRTPKNIVRIFIDIFACVVCFYLAKASVAFVQSEKAMGGLWIVQVIIPFGFAMVSLEYAVGAVLDILRIGKPVEAK